MLDAYRRELLRDAELGLGNTVHISAYRLASLVPGSLSLILADRLPWPWVFAITALFMLPGLLLTLAVSEPALRGGAKTLRRGGDAIQRVYFPPGPAGAAWVLGFIFFFFVQTGRQHGHRAGHAVLSGHRL